MHDAGGGDVGVAGRMVEEVDIDAVGVVRGTEGCDGSECCAGLLPEAAGHGSGVVDQQDGVEGAEEGVGVVGASCGTVG